jgi:hypothetical protein
MADRMSETLYHFINLLHDLSSPLNCSSNQPVTARTSLGSTKQIIRRLHVQTGEDRRHDADHPFAAFIHRNSVADSRFVRHTAMSGEH